MDFTSGQLQHKCLEQNVNFYTAFFDLTRAFDIASRVGLWENIMTEFGCLVQ